MKKRSSEVDGTDGEADQPLTLVIGDQRAWDVNASHPPFIEGFKFIDIDALEAKVFDNFPAAIVLSALMTRNQDAIEIARKLKEFSFEGRYRVIADALPNPDLVAREVKAAAPDIDFEVLNLPSFNLFG